MVQAQKKIALLHRYPADRIKETNAAFPYLQAKGIDVLTFKKFNRLNSIQKLFKSVLWIFYAPMLVFGKGYDVIYCDDSFPFYPALVKLASPHSKVVIRIGDLHLMYYTSGWLYKFLHFFERVTWKTVDSIIPISNVMGDFISNSVVVDNLNVVLDPIDPLDFLPANTLKNPEKIVMFHGLLTRNKNVDLLIEAAKRMPSITFWVVGDGPDAQRLKSIAPKNVIFHGWKPFKWMYSLINQCDVGVALRSKNPGNEYVVTSPFLQYGAMGKPCLVTRRAVFGDYPWQFSSIEEMVTKMKSLLFNPRSGDLNRKYVLQYHDAKKIAEEIWTLLSA